MSFHPKSISTLDSLEKSINVLVTYTPFTFSKSLSIVESLPCCTNVGLISSDPSAVIKYCPGVKLSNVYIPDSSVSIVSMTVPDIVDKVTVILSNGTSDASWIPFSLLSKYT